MTDSRLDPALLSPPPDPPAYRPFPEVAESLRAQSSQILKEWRSRTLLSLPELGELSVREFKDDIARILSAMADALESNDPPDLQRLVRAAPAHGFQRFLQEYGLAELFAEERVLRRVIIARVEAGLGRQCDPQEAAALHAMIDIMLQQGVLALVHQQKADLRRASEVQLKYLSFLSHDLSNNLFVITMGLAGIEAQLASLPEMRESTEMLRTALGTIRHTREGMRRLLEHERLRNSHASPEAAPVKLREIVERVVRGAAPQSASEGPRFEIDIDPRATAYTNADLIAIILQNLIGNAVKHAASGRESDAGKTVRIGAERVGDESWTIAVVDSGPGIPEEQVARLFDAFEQLPRCGEDHTGTEHGFGLGLAIASQAARLLGTAIEVESKLGRGSRFSFRLPAPRLQIDMA